VLTKILLGFGILSNVATFIGLWMNYLTSPQSIQQKAGHVFLIVGATASVVLYALILYRIIHKHHAATSEPLQDGAKEIQQLKQDIDTQKAAANSARAFADRLEKQLQEATQAKDDLLCNALKQIAKTDAEKINERVRQIRQRIKFNFYTGADPSIDVITELWNGSIFDLVNTRDISGRATYGGHQLAAAPIIFPESTVLNLKHGDKISFTVRQYLSVEMAKTIEAGHGRGIAIDLTNVAVRFDSFSLHGLAAPLFRWFGPQFTIEDAERPR